LRRWQVAKLVFIAVIVANTLLLAVGVLPSAVLGYGLGAAGLASLMAWLVLRRFDL
jgi:hypothetical protein